jgi:hypothetical protein
VIPGGGVGDGDIDGEINVHIIDGDDEPIEGATVEIGDSQKTTDEDGLVVFSDVEGAQTIAVKANGFRSAVWVGANGANVTIPLTSTMGPPDSATLTGTINGWNDVLVANGHVKVAIILYSQSDRLGDAANDLQTPNNGNTCFGDAPCNWTLVSRTGPVTITAAIIDLNGNGTPLDQSDDTQEIVKWAFKSGVMVEAGVDQSGHALEMVGNYQNLEIEKGTPPAALTEVTLVPGIELSADEVVQIPAFINTDPSKVVAPQKEVFPGEPTYRLTAFAQTPGGEEGAQSIVLRRGLENTFLEAGTWLAPPAGVEITRAGASWEAVSGAAIHSATWSDGTDDLLEITVLDGQTNAVDVPSLVSLPSSGTLSARVSAIAADIDLNNFSLEDDSQLIWGASAQPVSIP